MSKVDLLVSVKDEYMDRLSEVANRCESAGMHVEQRLENIGVLTGSVDSAEKVELLRNIEGVSHVEVSRRVRVAPPESSI